MALKCRMQVRIQPDNESFSALLPVRDEWPLEGRVGEGGAVADRAGRGRGVPAVSGVMARHPLPGTSRPQGWMALTHRDLQG